MVGAGLIVIGRCWTPPCSASESGRVRGDAVGALGTVGAVCMVRPSFATMYFVVASAMVCESTTEVNSSRSFDG